MKNIKNAPADKSELVQVLDKFGNETGKLVNRCDAHGGGVFHNEVACIVINFQKQILLQKRSDSKKSYPGCWALCAGHVVGFQPIEEAIITEMKEELGSEIKEENIFLLVPKTKNEREDNKCFVTCFAAFINKPAHDFVVQHEEIQEFKWFDFDEFKSMVKNEKGTIFKNNEYYNRIITELEKLFGDKNFYKKVDELTEKFEELDRYGNPTGKIVTREFAHNYGIYHKAASLFIINEKNEILLQKRSKTKIRNGGLWDIAVSGHVRYGEDDISSLIRETEEEVGINLDPKSIKFLVKDKENRQFSEKFIDNIYTNIYVMHTRSKIKDIKNLEVDGIKFVTLSNLKEMMKTYKELAYKPVAFNALVDYIEKRDILST